MEPVLSRCGYRCDLCLAYSPSVADHPENQQILSNGWFKYFGFRIPAEEIHCSGCLADNARLIDTGCPVRPCVIKKGFDNCAPCEQYGCSRLGERWVTLEEMLAKSTTPIPIDDYQRFILPYENKKRLDELRSDGSL
ncbi:MAG: DUF3795 domain-containing protein [Anaerolineaceae bacterium]|jgi:hypothetical protein